MPERVTYTVAKHALIPAGAEAHAVQDALKIGSNVNVEIYQPRDEIFARKVNTVFERIGKAKGMRVRNVRGWLATATGRADLVTLAQNGQWTVVPVPHGTGPRDMNAIQFEAFWEDAREIIFRDVLPTLLPDDAAEIARMIESMGL